LWLSGAAYHYDVYAGNERQKAAARPVIIFTGPIAKRKAG